MAGIKALFTGKQLMDVFNHFEHDKEQKMLKILQYKGEEFINRARSNNTYVDRTGNLRSSIGYIIMAYGKVRDMNFSTQGKGWDKQTGKLEGIEFAYKKAREFPQSFVLIGVAGMKYAAHVENKGYDVITGSAPTKNELLELFDED